MPLPEARLVVLKSGRFTIRYKNRDRQTKIDKPLFKKLYMRGDRMCDIAELFGVSLQSCKWTRRALDLPPRKTGRHYTGARI